jgi:hypothetical protein
MIMRYKTIFYNSLCTRKNNPWCSRGKEIGKLKKERTPD